MTARTEAAAAAPPLSALQRRLRICAARPDEPWLVLTENVPQWPGTVRPAPRPDPLSFTYPDSQGLPVLAAAIARRENAAFGRPAVSAANVLVTNGAMHAMALLIRYAAGLGYRHAVSLTPMFRSIYELLSRAGLELSAVPVGTAGEVDLDLLAALCARPGTLLYLNLPHNPTGTVLTAELDHVMRRLALRQDLMIIYDAVYDSFAFGPGARPAPADLAAASPRFIQVNSMSKNYGRPGERVGWMVGRPEVISQLTGDLEREAVGINAVGQLAAAAVLEEGNQPLVAAVATGRAVVSAAQAVLLPPGGTQVWLDLGLPDVERFADYALGAHHLVLTTASNYFPAIPGHIRYPTGLKPEILQRGLRALDRARAHWAARA
jgi:aspartate aminotransferase